MSEAIAKVVQLQPNGKVAFRGTAFAISRELALTAFHVVGDRIQGTIKEGQFELRFPGGVSCKAIYDGGDGKLDFALLSLQPPLEESFEPIRLTVHAQNGDGFFSFGFPPVSGIDLFTICGTIRNLQATIMDGVPAIQLFSPEAAAQISLKGMSGAPVLVGPQEEQGAIGLIRWNPTGSDQSLPAGGTLFACPVAALAASRADLRARMVQISKPLPAAVLHNLPFVPNPLFSGRQAELEELTRIFQEERKFEVTKTVVVHGLGGVGKTQLAIQYAWKRLREFDAVLWANANTPERFEAGLAALASVLRLHNFKDGEQSVQVRAVLDWLHDNSRWLLIADNVDDSTAVKAVFEKLAPTLQGDVLITSRLSRWPVTVSCVPLDSLQVNDAALYLLNRVAKENHKAGSEADAKLLAEELGNLPLALEQATAFIIEARWSFSRYREQFGKARPELLSYEIEDGIEHPASVAKTWSITLVKLSLLARTLLRIAAWFAPDLIPRGIFLANGGVLSEALGQESVISHLAIDKALGELDRYSLIRLTTETASVHRLLQAVEQDSLTEEQCQLWLLRGIRLVNAFAPPKPDDVRTWDIWLPLQPHVESLLYYAQRHGVENAPVGLAANQLGVLLATRALYRQAEPLMRRALTIEEKTLGADHPNVAVRLSNLASILTNISRPAEAEPLLRRALGIQEKRFGLEDPRIAIYLNNLAELLRKADRPAEAEPLYRRALGILKKGSEQDRPILATCLNNLALVLTAPNQQAEAEQLYRQALEIDEQYFGSGHPAVATDLGNFASLLQATDRAAEAEPLLKRVLEIHEKTFGPQHPSVAIDLNNLAEVLRKTDRPAEAEPLSRRHLQILAELGHRSGREHQLLRSAVRNYEILLSATGLTQEAIAEHVRSAIAPEPG
jgi:tetratricopeptide (TPR) repeat protein